MWSKNFTFLLLVCVVLLHTFNVDARKYGRNKSRGSSSSRRGSGSNRHQTNTVYKAPQSATSTGNVGGGWVLAKPQGQTYSQGTQNTKINQHKPSAPPDPNHSFIAHEKKQQSHSNAAPPQGGGSQTAQRPNIDVDANKKVGWNVDSAKPSGQNSPGNERPIGWNVGNTPTQNTGSNQHVSFVNGQPNQPINKNTAGNLGNAQPPPYQQYPTNTGYNNHPNGPPPPYQQYPTNTGFSNHPNGQPPPYQQYPTNTGFNNHYPNQGYNNPQSGFNPNPGYNPHYYPQQGHYGGFGGGSPYGGYNYGLAAFGKPKTNWGGTISNVLAGAFIWHLVSGLVSKPYKVYNYNSQAESVPPKIELPPNLITTCPENITSLCAPNTFALCTTNQTIMCVASAAQVAPCGANSNVSCISSTAEAPSPGPQAPNKPAETQNNTINVPCISNATITGSLEGGAFTSISVPSDVIKASKNGELSLCVTTIAIPQTDEEVKAVQEAAAKDSQEAAAKAAQAQPQPNLKVCPLGEQPDGTGTCVPVTTLPAANATTSGPLSSPAA